MARQHAAELARRGPTAPTAAVPVPPEKSPDEDLVRWVDRTGVSASRLMTGGLALASTALLGAWVLPFLGMLGTIAFGSAFTIGGGLAFLGFRKWQRDRVVPIAPAMTPERRALLEERSRRVLPVLSGGAATFAQLMTQLHWTEPALVETLGFMRDAGLIVEDLDLDTGVWIYRLQPAELGGRAGPTLADRQSRLGLNSETTA